MSDAPWIHPRPVARFSNYDRAAQEEDGRLFAAFVRLSVDLTGFSEAELAATGMALVYFEVLGQIVGTTVRQAFLDAGESPDALMKSSRDGALARNVIRMWYLGQWKRLDSQWVADLDAEERTKFDEFGRNTDHVVSSRAYQEGLVWAAIGAHPMGAKQPGFGSWGQPLR